MTQHKALTLADLVARTESTESGCLLWTGGLRPDGYPNQVMQHRRRWQLHRLAHTLATGVEPVGLVLDHLCHTNDLTCAGGPTCLHRRCINPEHLEPVTAIENNRRAWRERTHCPHGHEFVGWNVIIQKRSGTKTCRTCLYARNRIAKQRAREQVVS